VFDDQSSNKKKTLIFTKLAKNRYDRLKLKEQKKLLEVKHIEDNNL